MKKISPRRHRVHKDSRRNFSSRLSALAVLLFLFHQTSFAQIIPPDNEQKSEDQIEKSVENTDNSEVDYEGLIDLQNELIKHPIDLNKATAEDLQPLMDLDLLSGIQANSIISYRDKLGNFISIFELQAVPYLDVETIKGFLPFVKINSDITDYQITAKELLTKGDYMIMMRGNRYLEEQKGFSPIDSTSTSTSRYLGSPYTLYARFKYSYGTRFSYGITAQKDAGEQFFSGTQKHGFDFYSAHVYYRGNHFLKAVSLGDYELKFGQGLIMYSGFSTGKSPAVMLIKRGGSPLHPYTSVNEYTFFRGGAAVVGNKNISLTGFFSYKPIDGNVTSVDTISEEGTTISSIGVDGYHRTTTELADKNTVKQTVFGGNLDVKLHSLTLGATAIETQLSVPVVKDYQPYNQYQFSGDHLSQAGAHFDWNYRNFNLFGEAALSNNGGKAMTTGMIISIDPRVDLALLYRNFSKDYQFLFANAFAESTTPDNEKGFYTGISIRPKQGWQLDAYADIYHKPWLSFGVNAPSIGTDYFTQLTYKPNKVLIIYARWKDENKQANASPNSEPINYLVDTRKQDLRFNVSYKASPTISLQSRAEWVFFHETNLDARHGFLAFQDVSYRRLGSPVQLTMRMCLFDADTYDARIYAYENDVLYAFSIPSFQNQGMRFYVVSRFTITRGIDVWLRYAQTYYTNLSIIGSGLDEIDGNTKSEVKAEVRFKF